MRAMSVFQVVSKRPCAGPASSLSLRSKLLVGLFGRLPWEAPRNLWLTRIWMTSHPAAAAAGMTQIARPTRPQQPLPRGPATKARKVKAETDMGSPTTPAKQPGLGSRSQLNLNSASIKRVAELRQSARKKRAGDSPGSGARPPFSPRSAKPKIKSPKKKMTAKTKTPAKDLKALGSPSAGSSQVEVEPDSQTPSQPAPVSLLLLKLDSSICSSCRLMPCAHCHLPFFRGAFIAKRRSRRSNALNADRAGRASFATQQGRQ